MRRILRTLALFFLCSAAVPVAVTGTVLATFLFAPLPATLPAEKASIASQITHVLDANGKEIAVFREFEQNIPVKPSDIPESLKQAVVAAEDRRFYKHGGVDLKGSIRAFYADVRKKGVVQGGSTITQQYVKNAYTDKQRTVVRKVREAVLASQLDRQLSKAEILFKYVSSIYLGDGAYGVGAASENYFRKPVSQLTISESALLAGLIPAPSNYEPRGNPQLAEQRRVDVLNQMLAQHVITPEQYQVESAKKLFLASSGKPPAQATVVYPPRQDGAAQFPYFVDYVRRYLIAKYGPATVFRGGLTVQTTLDPEIQSLAEKTVADQLKGTKDPVEMGLASVEPPTGFVKALVGGRDFANGPYAQVNLALGGCPIQPTSSKTKVEVRATCWDGDSVEGGGAGRQPGSAFKPFTLATALSKGYSPSKVYPAPRAFQVPGCRGPNCTIGNNEGEGGGSATIRSATVESINTVYAQMIRDVGVKDTAEMAKKLGIDSAWYSPQVHGLSYTLGVLDVSPLNMASAYGVFSNGGKRQAPTPVLIVRDVKGKIIEDNSHRQGDQVIDKVVADNETDILRGVITSGTGRAANIGRPAAGKTGTAEQFVNAWFVGYTPTLSTAVWMGKADGENPNNPSSRLIGIRGVSRVFGGTIPAQTWHNFMAGALKDVPITDFDQPAPIKQLADAIAAQQRQGIDPGTQRTPTSVDEGGPYVIAPGTPKADAPTTSTTLPPDAGGGGGGGGTSTTTTSTTLVPRA